MSCIDAENLDKQQRHVPTPAVTTERNQESKTKQTGRKQSDKKHHSPRRSELTRSNCGSKKPTFTNHGHPWIYQKDRLETRDQPAKTGPEGIKQNKT